MKAETTRRPLRPAWASTFLMKCTRQRCQVAFITLATEALMPSCASEMTSLTPRRPRRASLRRKSVQRYAFPEGRGCGPGGVSYQSSLIRTHGPSGAVRWT